MESRFGCLIDAYGRSELGFNYSESGVLLAYLCCIRTFDLLISIDSSQFCRSM